MVFARKIKCIVLFSTNAADVPLLTHIHEEVSRTHIQYAEPVVSRGTGTANHLADVAVSREDRYIALRVRSSGEMLVSRETKNVLSFTNAADFAFLTHIHKRGCSNMRRASRFTWIGHRQLSS